MKNRIIKNFLIAFLSIIFFSTLAVSDNKGEENDKKRPPGWEKGEKKGWQSDKPPGLDEKNGQAKKKANKSEKKQKKEKSKSAIASELENEKEDRESELKEEKEKQNNKLKGEETTAKGKKKKKKK